MTAVAIHALTKDFGPRVRALNAVSFDIPVGSVFGLLGPNGAGKTTLFSIAAGFLKPTAGRIEVLGIDIERIGELRGRFSILPQDALFQANVPVIEQIVFFAQLSGMTRQEAEKDAHRALALVGLSDQEKKNARTLSHGMTKRLGIAQAFLGRPEVIFLDEPTAGLDPMNAAGIRKLIADLKREGVTLVISSHDLNEVQEMCSHVAILDHGRLVECRTVAELTRAGTELRMTFSRPLTDAEVAGIGQVPGVHAVATANGEYAISLDGSRPTDQISAEIVGRLAAGGVVPRSVREGASLVSEFLKATGGAA